MRPQIVGILNLNHESFFDGGKYTVMTDALLRCKEMISQWVDIIEIGGFSTKPWSIVPPIDEELRRIIPTLEKINELWFPISVETSRKEIVQRVIEYGNVVMINDTSWLRDVEIPKVLSHTQWISYVLMHNPTDYHLINNLDPHYEDIIKEVYDFLEEKINYMKNIGFNDIIIDPWFFFHKWVQENISLIQNLDVFHKLWLPIFVAISRKSCILKIEDCSSNLALIETCIMNFKCIEKWAQYIRVHDIEEAKHVIKIANLYN